LACLSLFGRGKRQGRRGELGQNNKRFRLSGSVGDRKEESLFAQWEVDGVVIVVVAIAVSWEMGVLRIIKD